ncbi:MAG: hypothetical protein IT377_31350 [Polyangiaceae bacterium]|nr:hypothetical protein [Polyangiaceae bacterium]
MVRFGSLVFLVLVGCSSPELRGGQTVAAGNEPRGRVLAAYRGTGCVDAAGGALEHPVRVVLVEGEAKRPVLIARRPSYDSVVIPSLTSDGRERVFQVVSKAERGGEVLHDFRLPVGEGDGRMAVATEFVERAGAPGQVVAQVSRMAFACRLAAERGAK